MSVSHVSTGLWQLGHPMPLFTEAVGRIIQRWKCFIQVTYLSHSVSFQHKVLKKFMAFFKLAENAGAVIASIYPIPNKAGIQSGGGKL